MGQKIDRTYLFERMPVGQAVRRQIIPSIASQMVILLSNLADTSFVGLLNDAAQTAAHRALLHARRGRRGAHRPAPRPPRP